LSKAPKKIAVRLCNWIGDVVMNLPALEAIRRHEPDAEITVIARDWVRDVVSFRPDLVDDCLCFDDRKGPVTFLRFCRMLRTREFDIGFSFLNHIKGAMLMAFSGVPVRVGFGNLETSVFLNHSLVRKALPRDRQQCEDYLDLVAAVGYDVTPRPRPRMLRDHVVEEALMQHHAPLRAGPVLSVQAGAAFGTAKRWFPERYAEVCQRFIDTRGGTVVLLGSSAEADLNEAIANSLPYAHVCNLVGQTSLRESISLISMSDAFLSGDSGLAHVAAAFEVPQVTIFGSTDPSHTFPNSPKAEILFEKVPCNPCFQRHCPLEAHRCMEAVTADHVHQALSRALVR